MDRMEEYGSMDKRTVMIEDGKNLDLWIGGMEWMEDGLIWIYGLEG